MDANDEAGIDLHSINFRQGEDDLVIEVTYAERRHVGLGVVKFQTIMFEARKAYRMVENLISASEDLVDEMLIQLDNPPLRRPGRRNNVPS